MNPQTEFQQLLQRHKFRLVRQKNHYVYQDPEGRVLVVSKTPSDYRAWRNMVSTLRRVVSNPVPCSVIVEEESQRKELESMLALHAQQKKKTGASRPHGKSRGTGFIYEDTAPVPFVPEEVKEAARNDKRWDGLIRHVRMQRRGMEDLLESIHYFARAAVCLAKARQRVATDIVGARERRNDEMLANIRRYGGGNFAAESAPKFASCYVTMRAGESLYALTVGGPESNWDRREVKIVEEKKEQYWPQEDGFADLCKRAENDATELAMALWHAVEDKPSWIPEHEWPPQYDAVIRGAGRAIRILLEADWRGPTQEVRKIRSLATKALTVASNPGKPVAAAA